MRLLIALAFLDFVYITQAYSSPNVTDILNDIAEADYDSAIKKTIQLDREQKDNLIQEVFDALYDNSEKNFFGYVYLLGREGGSSIAVRFIAPEVETIFSGRLVELTFKENGRVLKFDRNLDQDGDRKAYGDDPETTNRIIWSFSYTYRDDNIFFYILGTQGIQYLKLAVDANANGEHEAFGGDRSSNFSDRYRWYLVPARSEGKNLYYIVNKEFNQALKIVDEVDDEGDYIALGNNGRYKGKPEQLAWIIMGD